MAKSSEDVLLVIGQVKNKKCDGSLYVMSERMAWMPALKNTFTYSYGYEEIKSLSYTFFKLSVLEILRKFHVNGGDKKLHLNESVDYTKRDIFIYVNLYLILI